MSADMDDASRECVNRQRQSVTMAVWWYAYELVVRRAPMVPLGMADSLPLVAS